MVYTSHVWKEAEAKFSHFFATNIQQIKVVVF